MCCAVLERVRGVEEHAADFFVGQGIASLLGWSHGRTTEQQDQQNIFRG